MPAKLLAFSALAAALAVSGCSSTGGGGGGGPTPPPTISESGGLASVLDADNGLGTGTGSFQVNRNGGTVTVADRTYNFAGGNEGTPYGGIRAFAYESGNPNDPNGAAAYFGDYAAAVAIADNTGNPNRAAFLVGGQETTRLPSQTANYDGVWSIVDMDNRNANGVFAARADFDARDVDFGLYDGQGNTQYGAGGANIISDSKGIGFQGQLTTNPASGMPGDHNTAGYFYGPNANEIAGVIGSERPSGTDTAGFLIGGRR